MKEITKPTKIGICIINFHQPQLTENCLRSLAKQTAKQFSIYVLDNDTPGELSTDNHIHYYISKKNLGFAGGNNFLIQKAVSDGCDAFILLNNDTEVTPTFIEEFQQNFKQVKARDIVGCIITHLTPKEIIWYGGGTLHRPMLLTQHKGLHKHVKEFKDKPQLIPTDWVTGCALGFQKTLIDTIGLLDETFFAYLEDVDFCIRAQKAGGRCFVINKPLVQHAISPSVGISGSNIFTKKKIYFQARNSVLLIKKHMNGNRVISIVNSIMQILIYLFQRRLRLSQIPFFLRTTFTYW